MAKRPSALFFLLVAALIVGVIWYRVTPRRAYAEFIQGIALGDKARLEHTVDFARLRAHFRSDLTGAVERVVKQQKPGDAPPNTSSVLDTLVAEAVTVPGLTRIVTSLLDPGVAASISDTSKVPTVITYHYRSPIRVDIRIQHAGQPDAAAPNFTFELHGTRWRLTHLWTEQMTGSPKGS
jgi:hypothetical protein